MAHKKAHEAMATANKASATASIASRAVIVWVHKIIQLILLENCRLLEGATRVLKASAIPTDATLDALTFACGSQKRPVVRVWQADFHTKYLVSAYPFQDDCLFGAH